MTAEEEPHTVIAADLNKDGHLDLAVSNRTAGTVSIHLGSGTATLPNQQASPSSARAESVSKTFTTNPK